MNETEKTTETTSRNFHCQWDDYVLSEGQVFALPSCTIPDQSMTIPEIIAKFTRTGQLPAAVKMTDKGGNIAADPESDPLDDYFDVQAAAAAAKAAQAAQAPAAQEPEDPAPAPAGA